ncbi:MAG: transposon-encoded TnpW family protein [Lachnospiraceae bacterium]|nr:transposon-encoded TnpW family protein [Lachnospiraceae bacterium]
MTETKNEQQPYSFKRKLGNTTYTVKVHFSKDTDKAFKHRVQNLIINVYSSGR